MTNDLEMTLILGGTCRCTSRRLLEKNTSVKYVALHLEKDITRHEKTVHGKYIKGFACTECPKKFEKRSGLNYHIEIHHTEKPQQVDCSLCDKTFLHPEILKRHMKNVHVEPSHECSQCQSKFKLKCKLDRHIKEVHNKVKIKQQIPDGTEEMSSFVIGK